MENSYNVNYFSAYFEVDGIREPVEQRSPHLFLNLRKLEWILRDSLHSGVQFNEKFRAKSSALVFIPSNSFEDIEIGFIP
jgi:hypothetical protein